jgi:hypothetical protein
VLDDKDGVSACLSLFKSELSLGEKAMEVTRTAEALNAPPEPWSSR